MTIRARSIQLAALASLVGFVLAFSPALAFGQISKDDQKCINELNKNLGKVMKTQGKELDKCIKFGASGKLGAQSIEECTTADNGGKVGAAKAKTVSKVSQKCVAPPPFGGTDATTVNDTAVAKEILLIHDIFGTDLDQSAILKSVNKSAHKCQVDVSKAAHKCQDTKLKVYNKCKKDGLKGKTPPGVILSAQDLEDLCLGIGANPIPDPDNKISDACVGKLADKISSKCAGVPQGDAFPGACVVAPDLRACIDELVECRVCLALNNADALARDCDLFDDGQPNGSCPPASPACGDGVLQEPLGEECDDGNNISGDGCTADCQDEFCGDGTINDAPNEQCDDGNTQDGDCCSSSCQLESAATVCRASAGVCDPEETCTGASPDCPADILLTATTQCRASAGICDVAESCTGSSAACPADGFVSATTECRASAGVCDVAESCTGSGAACPADGFVSATTECRASAGDCDVAESCTGGAADCPADSLASATTECRATAGDCDVAESCTGSGVDCPADGFESATTECRASAGICDVAESCTGGAAACPADGFVSATTECRASAGICDVAESCTGGAADCPADGFESATTECRASAGDCDVAESCTGSAAACPADGLVSATTECRASAGICDVAESCTGSGAACPADGFVSATTECRASAGICDVAESCPGGAAACPADGFESATTECRASAGICDVAESCTGSGSACPADGFVSATTECRASAGICDVAESCPGGAAACPADGFESATTECRASAGICDVAESCTGSGSACPVDGLESATTECRASAGDCDVAESCTGSAADCPADGLASATTECRASAGICDIAESCTGSGVDCPADVFEPGTTECRADAGQCDVPEDCTGTGPDCPPDGFEPNGTGCDDADVCTPVDQCQDGVCLGSGTVCGDGVVQAICGEECDLPDDTACTAVEACNDDCLCQSFIGDHKCVIDSDPNNSFLRIITKILALPPFPASGALDILCGFEDPNTGKAVCECELQSLDPINITGIGYICFTPGDPNDPCPTGEIDCDGGNPLDVTMDSDHNIGACTSNADCAILCTAHCGGIGATLFNSACEGLCQGGVNEGLPCTDDSECPAGSCAGKPVHGALCQCDCADVAGVPSGAGALQCNLGANIDVEIGPPCDGADILIAVGSRCIPLTTEQVTSQMHNLNAVPGTDFPVPPFTAIGTGINCSALATSTTTGLQVVGSVNFFDSTIGDLQAQIVFGCL